MRNPLHREKIRTDMQYTHTHQSDGIRVNADGVKRINMAMNVDPALSCNNNVIEKCTRHTVHILFTIEASTAYSWSAFFAATAVAVVVVAVSLSHRAQLVHEIILV